MGSKKGTYRILCVCTLLFLNLFIGSAQSRVQQLKEKFDTLIYNEDSSIYLAAHLYKNQLQGYAVEFDYKFRPLWLGEYQGGLKNGTWLSSHGCWQDFKNDSSGGFMCVNHSLQDTMIQRFFKKYVRLTGIYTNYGHEYRLKNKFDTILYYNDSVIREVSMLKYRKKQGTAIVFDSLGNPSEIGQYKNGERTGKWLEIEGCMRKYRKGKMVSGGCSGCGFSRNKMCTEFYIRYKELTGIDLNYLFE